MILSGKIVEVVSDGYERCINIKFDDTLIGTLWCYLLDTNEYIEPDCNSMIMETDMSIKVKLSIDWVTNYTLDNSKEIVFKQTIHESSHIEAIADVTQIIDEYSVVCDIGKLPNIEVEFESKKNEIEIGNRISFSGNLKAELI